MNSSTLLDLARRVLGPSGRNAVSAFRVRRRTRLGRMLMALTVAASVLVVGHDPAQGAATDVDSTRLSGSTRYETAVEIAETYIDHIDADAARPAVDTVIITSGEDRHFAFALPTPALARLYDAPLLLTPSDELYTSITTFLTRHDISLALIVGGTGVVSEEVERSISAISGVTVTRIGSNDAYATAVEVAERVGWSPGRPGEISGHGRTALLATGEAFADALAAGPLAYRGEHPILLTPGDELPTAVSTFLSSSGTDHVIILGGTAAVSARVEARVERLNITVDRWMGADRFATAVEIAEELLGLDTPQECFDDAGDIGLAYGWRSPDAIVSGPLLGELCAVLLLTELLELPTVVEDFLKSDDYVTGDVNGRLRFTVFGGNAAVSDRAVDAAVNAAALVELRATVEAFEGACQFSVTFAEPVRAADAQVIASYLNGNSPFESSEIQGTPDPGSDASTTKVVVTLAGAVTNTGATVPTGCTTPLRARDRIGIVSGAIQAAADNRRVGRVEYFVADDERPPTLTLNATEGSNKVWVESSEPLALPVVGGSRVQDLDVVFRRARLADTTEVVQIVDGVTRFEVTIPSVFGAGLKIGDSVSIAAGEVNDLAGNANVLTRNVVARDSAAPRVSRITVTEPKPVSRASVELNGSDGTNSRPAIVITSKAAAAAAAGASGNDWTVDLDRRSSRPSNWSSTQRVSVQVSTTSQRIQVVALAAVVDPADVDDVVNELNADRAFNQLFTAAVAGTAAGTDAPLDTGGRVRLSGGASTVDLTVEWSEAVRTGDNASDCTASTDHPVRVRLIEIDVDSDGTTDFDLDGFRFGNSDVTFVAGGGSDSITAGSANCDTTTAGVRAGTLVARVQSQSIGNLPSTRSTAVVRSGAVTDLAGNANAHQSQVRLQRS